MKTNRICHITTVHGSLDNRIFSKECVTLTKFGFDVYLIAPHGKNEDRQGVHIIDIQRSSNRLWRMLYVSTIVTLIKALRVRADLYHLHDPELMPMGLLLRLLGKKVVYDVHENTSGAIRTKFYLPKWMRGIVARSIGFVENFCGKMFSGIVAARPDIVRNFDNKNKCIVRNFPSLNFVPKDGHTQKELHPKKRVVYSGGMTRIRGIVQLVDAFDQQEDAELWLLGPFKEQGLQAECEASPGWRNVKYLGTVLANEVFDWIQQADAGIVTFLPAPNHVTSLATKPFEYMACGLPMIMSDFPYWKETFGDMSLYVDPANPNDIRSAIQKLFKDQDQCEEMGAKGRKKVLQEYNWENESHTLLKFYEQVLH